MGLRRISRFLTTHFVAEVARLPTGEYMFASHDGSTELWRVPLHRLAATRRLCGARTSRAVRIGLNALRSEYSASRLTKLSN